jgi:hypothetical protein
VPLGFWAFPIYATEWLRNTAVHCFFPSSILKSVQLKIIPYLEAIKKILCGAEAAGFVPFDVAILATRVLRL